jgi:hypothetical protein
MEMPQSEGQQIDCMTLSLNISTDDSSNQTSQSLDEVNRVEMINRKNVLVILFLKE